MATATYSALIDWNNDGDFSDTGEDVTSRVFADPGITIRRGRDQVRSFAPPQAGACDFELDNNSNDYSPENTASPLYGNLLPGRTVKVRSSYDTLEYDEAGLRYDEPGVPYDGAVYDLFTGVLDDLGQHSELPRRSVTAPSLGPLSRLAGKLVSTALYQNVRTDQALGYLLDAVGVSSTDRQISTGQTTLEWWWLDEEDALQAAITLLNSEGAGAALYENGQGKIVFEDRNYRLTATRSSTSQATYRSFGTEPVLSLPLEYSPRLQDIINVATVEQRTRTAGALGVVWSLGATVSLSAGQTKTFIARSSSGDPFTGAVTPVAATDYTVTVGSLSAVTLNRTSGANITITLTAGGSGATVTGLQLRAQLVSVTNRTQLVNGFDASTSIARYGRRTYTLPVRAEIGLLAMQDLVDAIVSAYHVPRAMLELRLVGVNDERLVQIHRREVSDRVTVYDSMSLFSGDLYVERIEHRIERGGFRHEVVLGCEKVAGASFGLWDSGVWDTSLWGF